MLSLTLDTFRPPGRYAGARFVSCGVDTSWLRARARGRVAGLGGAVRRGPAQGEPVCPDF
eukprot:4499103-Prymnesium_polylepis.2